MSKDGGDPPTAYSSAGQYLDESGVSTSSISSSSPSGARPNSNLVSARMIPPRLGLRCAACVDGERGISETHEHVLADRVDRLRVGHREVVALSAFVVGVKSVSGSRSASRMPGGIGRPCTVP